MPAYLIVQRTNAAVLAVTDTWLDESVTDSEIELNSYIVHRKDRNRKGGGVCLFIRSDIAFNPKPELSADDLESLYVNILLPKTKPILIGVCYTLNIIGLHVEYYISFYVTFYDQ